MKGGREGGREKEETNVSHSLCFLYFICIYLYIRNVCACVCVCVGVFLQSSFNKIRENTIYFLIVLFRTLVLILYYRYTYMWIAYTWIAHRAIARYI